MEYISRPIVEGDPSAGAVVVFRDITQRKLAEGELEYYAFTDPMTGVANRRTGFLILEKELLWYQGKTCPYQSAFLMWMDLKKSMTPTAMKKEIA